MPPTLTPVPRPLRVSLRATVAVAYVVYLAAVVYLVWTPSPSLPGRGVNAVVEVATRLGLAISPTLAEFGLNVVMLVPLSLIGGLLFRRVTFSDWVAIGFLTSITVEVGQRLVLPTRSGSSRDIVANTLGALIGAAILTVLIALLHHHTKTPHPGTMQE